MLEKQIAKYPTYVEWAYQTIARFWEMSQDSNIRQCWTEQEWKKNLPVTNDRSGTKTVLERERNRPTKYRT